MLRAIALFVVLNLIDLAGTIFLLRDNSGKFYEANPLANYCLQNWGLAGLSCHKMLWVSIVSGICFYIGNFHLQFATRLAYSFSVAAFLVCLWTLLIYLTGEMMVSAVLIVAFVGLVVMSFALAWMLDERSAMSRKIESLESNISGLEFDKEMLRQELASWQGVSHGWTTQKILTTETYT